MTVRGIRAAAENLSAWSASAEWEPLYFEVSEAHFDPFAGILDAPADDIAEILGDAFNTLEVFIIEDFLTARFGEDGEKNVVDD